MEQKRNLIFDLGMHVGDDAEYYLRKGFRVISVEADPLLAARADKRLTQYLESGDLTIVNSAIVPPEANGDYPESISFYRSAKDVCGSISHDWAIRNQERRVDFETVTVSSCSFGSLLDKYGIPYYLKIDIEGADNDCLRELQSVAVKPIYLSIEAERESRQDAIEQISLLTSLGYDQFQLTQQQNKFRNQEEPNPPREGSYSDFDFNPESSGLFGLELPSDEWFSADQTIENLSDFIRQRAFWGRFQKPWLGRKLHGLFVRGLSKPLPGWLDIHARNSQSSAPEK